MEYCSGRTILRIFACVFVWLWNAQPLVAVSDTTCSDTEECKQVDRREATIISHGRELLVEGTESSFEKRTWGKDVHGIDEIYYVLDESKSVFYVPNFLNASTAQELQNFCLGGTQERFVRSPVRGGAGGATTREDGIRTSESCILLPAAAYLSNPRFQAMRQEQDIDPHTASYFREVDVAWDVSKRAASLLDWDPFAVEPLQIVRYTSPGSYYNVHHDHGEHYGKTTEHRPWTVLAFLNDVAKGGHTHFPELHLRIVPRGGDAIVWSNVLQQTQKADPDMVHAGEPPSEEGIEKYAVNIWLSESSLTGESLANGKWETRDGKSQE